MKKDERTRNELIAELESIYERVNNLEKQVAERNLAQAEAKRAEEELRERERRLTSIYNTVGDVIFHLAVEADGKYRFVLVNRAFCKVTGLSEDMVVGKLVNEIIPEPSLSMVLGKYKQAIEENAIIRWEEISDYPTGRLIGDVSIAPVVDDTGRCTHLVGSVHNITERKLAEKALRDVTEQLRALIHSSPVAIIVLDPNGIVKLWNPASEKIFGWTETEAHDRFLPYVPQDKREEHDALRARVLRGESFTGVEVRRRRKDGTTVDLSVSTAPLRDDQGRVTGIMSVNVDITERKLAEAALRESEDKFKYVFDHLVIGNSITLPSGEVNANKGLSEMLGLSQEELNKQRWQAITHPDDIELTQKALDSVISGGKDSVRFVKRYIHKNGSIVWGDVSTSLRRDQHGEPLYFMTAVVDITMRKRAEEALKESEQRLRQFYESGLIGVIYWNMNSQITDANNKFLEMVGYSRDELAAGLIDWGNMTPPEFRHLDVASVEELRATGINKTPFEKEYIRKDGTRVPIYLAGAMLDEKRFNGVAFVLDISERKQAEEQILRQLEELRRWQEVTLKREDRIRQLKHEVNELAMSLGEKVRYPSQEDAGIKQESENG